MLRNGMGNVMDTMRRTLWILALTASSLLMPTANGQQRAAHTNPLNQEPLVRVALEHLHELDYDGAVERFEEVRRQHAGDPEATALLLDATLFRELYRLDLLDTTFYANDGFLTGKHPTPEDPQARDRIFSLADEAVSEADKRLQANPRDVDALFARGFARSLKAVYLAMVERGFMPGMHLAIQAKDDCKDVLEMDPEYVDAKLVYGVYEYVVGALPWGFKVMIGFFGITGSKDKGLALLRDDGNRGSVTSVEAQTAIALFLRREAKYSEAIGIVHQLVERYPHNFLFSLEEANLRKDAGEGMRAVYGYQSLLLQAAKPGYFYEPHLDLAYFGLGDSLRGQRHFGEAAAAYENAAFSPTAGAELKRRSLVAAGMCRDLSGERKEAMRDYQMAIDLGADSTQSDLARQYLRKPYKEKQPGN